MRDYAAVLPALLELDLFRSGWNGCYKAYPDITPHQFAMQALRKSLVKKYEAQTPSSDLAALELFRKVNSDCETWFWDTTGMTELEAIAIGEAKDKIYSFFFPEDSEGETLLSTGKITSCFGLGNGANIGSFGTDFLSKIGSSTMAATDRLLHLLYMQAVSSEATWADLESVRALHRGYDTVSGSRLSFVPKTAEISRTICTEPVLNMLFQKGIAKLLEERLDQVFGIDLAHQPDKNRLLALIGSSGGEFGTIDLSSASDSISLGLMKEFIPRQANAWFNMTRSPRTTLPGGTQLELHMVSSMGNAFTFPLQTLLFSSLVYGAYRALDIPIQNPRRSALGNYAVFGDDIIVRKQAYSLVCKLLRRCGFSVNIDKSFNEGLFRESCGHDFYHGVQVRGVYIKRLQSVQDQYSAINRLNLWSAQHGVPLPNVIGYLAKGVRFTPIPFDESDDAGIKVPSCALRRKIWNKQIRGKIYYGLLYRFWESKSPSIDVNNELSLQRRLRGWIDNPSAIMVAALAGTLRGGKVVTRSNDRLLYRLRTRSSSSWDYIPFARRYCVGFSESWKASTLLNLNLS